MSLKFKITCDSAATTPTSISFSDSTECQRVISFNHKVGCKFDQLSGLWGWISSNKWVMFSIFLVIGTLICFLGRTLFKPILFIAGVFLAVFVVWLIFYSTFLKNNTKAWVGWVVLACSVILGLIVGACLVKLSKIGAFVLAAWGGFTVALLIYNSFLYKMDS
jgi:hypothetical protein